MFTSRSEYRILLRQDNADERLTQRGFDIGLASEERLSAFKTKEANVNKILEYCKNTSVSREKINPYIESKGGKPLVQGNRLAAIVLRSEVELTKNAKLRCRNSSDTSAEFIRIEGLSRENDTYRIFCNTEGYTCGQDVYHVGFSNLPFQTKFRRPVSRRINFPSQQKKDAIRRSFPAVGSHGGEMRLFLRVSNSKLLRKLNPNGFEAIFAKLSLAEVSDLITIAIPKETKQRVFVELPKYISELEKSRMM